MNLFWGQDKTRQGVLIQPLPPHPKGLDNNQRLNSHFVYPGVYVNIESSDQAF